MKKYLFGWLLIPVSCFQCVNAQPSGVPSFEEVISLQSARNPRLSPNGKDLLFQVTSADWKENRFDTEIWISKNNREPFQLTNNPEKSSTNPSWSPSGDWIVFLGGTEDKNQLFAIRAAGGESFQLTHSKTGVNRFEWSPDGTLLAFTQPENREKEQEARKKLYGGYAVEDQEYALNRLWVIPFRPEELSRTRLPSELNDSSSGNIVPSGMLPDSVNYSIENFKWSPDGKEMALQHQPDPLINSFFHSDISILEVDSGRVRPLVGNPSFDGLIDWSPDGEEILYFSNLDDTTSNYYRSGGLFRIRKDGTGNMQLARDFDENLSGITWNERGIFGMAYQKTFRQLLRIDPDSGSLTVILKHPERVYEYDFSKNGEKLAYLASSDETLNELYKTDFEVILPVKLTDFTGQMKDWKTAKSEVISWKSKDGQAIEGVLLKPQDYDPQKKYPLLVVIHGGPAGISVPSPAPSYVYPILQWLDKGALVLMPNYRGSAGYGDAFRALNVRNLGIGDSWDVLSGIDYLKKRKMIDPDRLGAMGWSQGGYISAFLTTHTDRFKAISVGAGISDWMTYYVNTDIHPFTRQYLEAEPWTDKTIYEDTSPISAITHARTPTLIQHGELDKRVPVPNAYELFQGLEDMGVDTRLIIYKGFGHGITKPKERLAATWHNWQWFGKYLWGEEIDLPMN